VGGEGVVRIAVCHPQTPFVRGGAEIHAEALVRALRDAGHEVELVQVPFRWYPADELVHQIGIWRSLDVTESNGIPVDMVIALKFPAYLVKHPNKVVWLIHQHRTAYELWDHPAFADLAADRHGRAVRDLIHGADRVALGEAKRIFTNSANVKQRLERSLGIEGEPLYHRSPMTSRLLEAEPGAIGDYVLYPSRFDRIKRQELLLSAMRATRSNVRLVLVGAGPQEQELRDLVRRAGLEKRVEFRIGIGDEELAELYRGALAVYYGPFDEDFGYVTLEGFAAARPVVTLTDSGGPLEFVRDGENGMVVEPDANAIAEALDGLTAETALAERMGKSGRETLLATVPDWPGVVAKLLG
jgi:glycosyltransferase involved in cell wall biosynthesis